MQGKSTFDRILVVCVEAIDATAHLVTSGANQQYTQQKLHSWPTASFLEDDTGVRLFEEIIRKSRQILEKNPVDAIALSLPGTLASDAQTIISSKRLRIRQNLNVAVLFKRAGLPSCAVFNDAECFALHEWNIRISDSSLKLSPMDTFCYIMADEGVGSTLYVGGRIHRGAGAGGHIGRLIVAPDGAFSRDTLARGCLEVFVGRPSFSADVVANFLSEEGKLGETANVATRAAFRYAVQEASKREWTSLPYALLAKGLTLSDPIITTVRDRASAYLGLAISHLVTITNPHSIVLGGRMISELPALGDLAVSMARRHCWQLAWNKTSITVSRNGSSAQPLGAVCMLDALMNRTFPFIS